MRKKVILLLVLAFQTIVLLGQKEGIIVPSHNDKYSQYVKKLEEESTDIDYADFRNSFLDSKQFSNKSRIEYDSLKKQLNSEVRKSNYSGVMKLAQQMLSIDYTSLFAHKYLQQS